MKAYAGQVRNWIYFIDPDDWIELNALSGAAEILENNPDILYVAYEENMAHDSVFVDMALKAGWHWIRLVRRIWA